MWKQVLDQCETDVILSQIGEGQFLQLKGYQVSFGARRLNVFKRSLVCVTCGLVGSIFVLEFVDKTAKRPHLNLYAKNDEGKLVLMTADHIKPKCRGGLSTMENLQTMCEPCNHKKGGKYDR